MEVLGKGYIIDHCVSKIVERNRKEALEIYVTDSLKVIAENTGGIAGGKAISKRFVDLFKPQETRTAEEIIESIKSRLEG